MRMPELKRRVRPPWCGVVPTSPSIVDGACLAGHLDQLADRLGSERGIDHQHKGERPEQADARDVAGASNATDLLVELWRHGIGRLCGHIRVVPSGGALGQDVGGYEPTGRRSVVDQQPGPPRIRIFFATAERAITVVAAAAARSPPGLDRFAWARALP